MNATTTTNVTLREINLMTEVDIGTLVQERNASKMGNRNSDENGRLKCTKCLLVIQIRKDANRQRMFNLARVQMVRGGGGFVEGVSLLVCLNVETRPNGQCLFLFRCNVSIRIPAHVTYTYSTYASRTFECHRDICCR